MNPLPKLEEWLARNTNEIAEIIEFTRSYCDPAPDKLNEMAAEINCKAANAGYLLADIESYLVTETALVLKNADSSMTQIEKKSLVDVGTNDILRLRDNLRVACRSLRSMGINVMSLRKYQSGGEKK